MKHDLPGALASPVGEVGAVLHSEQALVHVEAGPRPTGPSPQLQRIGPSQTPPTRHEASHGPVTRRGVLSVVRSGGPKSQGSADRDEELELVVFGADDRIPQRANQTGQVDEARPQALFVVGVDVVALGLGGVAKRGGGLAGC